MKTKRVKVIMLKTNPIQDENALIWKEHWEDGKLFVDNSPNCKRSRLERFCDCISYHLYFTTDDEIKEGDWFMSAFYSYPIHYTKEWINKHEDNTVSDLKFHKIVATTDPNLEIEISAMGIIGDGEVKRLYGAKKLPKPSKAFIEKYCKVGGIDEVEIEIEERSKFISDKNLRDDPKNGFNYNKIRVNSHNEITIHPIKDSWNRKEVEEIVDLYEAIIHGDDHVMTYEDMRKRIKEILK